MKQSARCAVILCWFFHLGLSCFAQPSIAKPSPAVEEQAAAKALFDDSNLATAMLQAKAALKINPADRNALFVLMEAAALQADEQAELKAAIELILTPGSPEDGRVQIARERIANRSANTIAFRSIAPALTALMKKSPSFSAPFALDLIGAEEDGYAGPSMDELARVAGLTTHWKLIGGMGHFSDIDFDQSWPPEGDLLSGTKYGEHLAEEFHFADGIVTLPDYFAGYGVAYGSSDYLAPKAGYYLLRAESKGTLQLLINGGLSLLKDDRFRKGPEVVTKRVFLRGGKNDVFVKFLPSASPFRISFVPETIEDTAGNRDDPDVPAAERSYIEAALQYQAGNYDAAEQLITAIPEDRSSLPLLLLASHLYSLGADSSMQAAKLDVILRHAPQAAGAELDLAWIAYGNERYEEALQHLGRALAVSPHSVRAQELKYEVASHFGWQPERKEALEERLRLHPGCGAIEEAEKFYSNAREFSRVTELDRQLEHCGAAPSFYWEALNRHGARDLALASMEDFVRAHPLDRSHRLSLIRQLVEQGELPRARQAAAELVRISPNSERFRQIALRPELALNAPHFQRPEDLQELAPFRRNALAEFAKSAETQSSATVLFDDHVLVLHPSGSADLYHHSLIQVWAKSAIADFGEVEAPRGARILELRTLKANGGFMEPEMSDNKRSISMPSLTPGDAVELESVQHFDDRALAVVPDEFNVAFGLPNARTREATYAVLFPAGQEPLVWAAPSLASPEIVNLDGRRTEIWRMHDLPVLPVEPSAPVEYGRPEIHMIALDRSRPSAMAEKYRNMLIDAAQITPHLQATANKLRRNNVDETVQSLYRFVTSSVRIGDDDWRNDEVTSADDTLQAGEGSRPALLIALASALGIKTELLLAAEKGASSECLNGSCYQHPLVRFSFQSPDSNWKSVIVDPYPEGLAIGALSPAVNGEPALVVPLHSDIRPSNTYSSTTVIVKSQGEERSTADGDLTLTNDGSMRASLHIQFGSWRSSQMRTTLKQLSAEQVQTFYEELASRLLPGAAGVKGTISHQDEWERPLELEISCKVGNFIRWNKNAVPIDQPIPQLSLRTMYASVPQRRYPMLIEVPLKETARYLLHLPDEITLRSLPQDSSLTSLFGTFQTRFRVLDPHTVEIFRDFDIESQTIAPQQYPEFSVFAAQSEEAERQEIVLSRTEARGAVEQRDLSASRR